MDFGLSQADYLASLNAVSRPPAEGAAGAQAPAAGAPAPPADLSRERLQAMPLPEQVAALMAAAQVRDARTRHVPLVTAGF